LDCVNLLFGREGIRMKFSDRRLAQRFNLTIPLYIRAWNSQAAEQKVESVNLSECGAYFETDKPPREGAMMHIRLEMPKEITGNPAAEWCCTGKVTRIQPARSPGALLGVSVRFDYYEVSRTTGPSAQR
jgi:PilZ domain-containing protein